VFDEVKRLARSMVVGEDVDSACGQLCGAWRGRKRQCRVAGWAGDLDDVAANHSEAHELGAEKGIRELSRYGQAFGQHGGHRELTIRVGCASCVRFEVHQPTAPISPASASVADLHGQAMNRSPH
jgi:hypothetical protein